MIRILVDSASDCRPGDAGIDWIIPIAINFGNREYRDGVDMDNEMFYSLLLTQNEFPRTSQPSPQDFLGFFQKVKESGEELLYFAVSSALSGTWQCAHLAKEMVGYDGIHIIDTKAATHMISLLANYAARLIRQGLPAVQTAEACEALKQRIRIFAGVDTLEYLYRGGRMSRATAAVGEVAGIKPVISITAAGKVEAIGKCLGRNKAMQLIIDRVKAQAPDPEFPIYSLYTLGTQNCEQLESKLAAAGHPVDARLRIGPTIGAHAGPGVYAVLYVAQA